VPSFPGGLTPKLFAALSNRDAQRKMPAKNSASQSSGLENHCAIDVTMAPNANSAPCWGNRVEYRAPCCVQQSEKSYTKTASWPLHAVRDCRHAALVIGHDGAIWFSQGKAPA
jgi:hypothetical protein